MVVAGKAAAARTCVYQATGVERIARFLVVRERVTEHERGIFCELVFQLACGFSFCSRDGRTSGIDLPCCQAGECSTREERVYR